MPSRTKIGPVVGPILVRGVFFLRNPNRPKAHAKNEREEGPDRVTYLHMETVYLRKTMVKRHVVENPQNQKPSQMDAVWLGF